MEGWEVIKTEIPHQTSVFVGCCFAIRCFTFAYQNFDKQFYSVHLYDSRFYICLVTFVDNPCDRVSSLKQ